MTNYEDILQPFGGIKILNVHSNTESLRIVDLEFNSREEFIKAASIQNKKINGGEFFIRFSSLTRCPQQTIE